MSSNIIIQTIYRKFLKPSVRLLGIRKTKELDAKFRFGREIDLDRPRTLADKICWLGINGDKQKMASCTDKYQVRSYVKEKGLEKILIPICGGPWDEIEKFEYDKLPNKFVLKATHGCEMNYICRNKAESSEKKVSKIVSKWLRKEYSRSYLEPHYRLIRKRVYAEEFLENEQGIIDYKIHCINGKPSFILTCSNRGKRGGLKLNLYDLEWNALDGIQGKMKNEAQIEKPKCLTEMIEIARKLAEEFPFVRVDLYQHREKVYFGELTFTPDSGVLHYFTDAFNIQYGKLLII